MSSGGQRRGDDDLDQVATDDLLGSFLLGTRVMSALVMIDSLSDNPAEAS
jgi:hypothetical protein